MYQCQVRCKWCKELCIALNTKDQPHTRNSVHFCTHADFDANGMVTTVHTVGGGLNSSNSHPSARN